MSLETPVKRRRRNDEDATGEPPSWDDLYLYLGHKIMKSGMWQENRKGRNIGIFGESFEVDVSTYIPLLTLRRMPLRNTLNEFLWYFRGEDHVQWLREQGNKYWDADADEDGWVGYNYGLLTHWPHQKGGHLNQLEQILKKIQAGEVSRTSTTTFVKSDEETKLESCIVGFQFFCVGDRLDMKVDQRSCDFSLGLPNDVFAMAVLLHLVCKSSVGEGRARVLKPGRLYWNFGHLHIYENNFKRTKELLERLPNPLRPQLRIRSNAPLLLVLMSSGRELYTEDLWKMFEIVDYKPQSEMGRGVKVHGRNPVDKTDHIKRPYTAGANQK